MSAPQLKLTYFDMTGRAELVRLALSYGEIEFQDDRVQFAQWKDVKPTTPLGQMPMLKVDDAVFCQSMALARYAARLSGLYPTEALEALKVDMLSETLMDAHVPYAEIAWRIKDETVKAEKTKAFLEATVPKIFGYLESKVEGKFFLGDQPTLVDLHLFDVVVNNFVPLFKDIGMSKYPKLEGVIEAVKTLPTIATYLDKTKKE